MNRTARSRPILTVGVVLTVTVVGGASPLRAQSPRFASQAELVALTVTVTDRSGHYVPDLTAGDFAILEQGRPQVMSHFAAGRVPIDMGLLLDTSTSMRGRLPLARQAARGLVRQLHAGDRGALAAIGSRVGRAARKVIHSPLRK
jgi:VWFA-related protein